MSKRAKEIIILYRLNDHRRWKHCEFCASRYRARNMAHNHSEQRFCTRLCFIAAKRRWGVVRRIDPSCRVYQEPA